MDLDEFFGWHNQYVHEPFGSRIDDVRHGQLMAALHNIVRGLAGSKAGELNTDDLITSRIAQEVEKTKKMMYTDLNAPWKSIDKTQEQLVVEGKALLAMWSRQTGVPIT